MRSIVEIDLFDEPYEINEKHSLKEDYEKHKSLLEIITVQECIYELISFCNSFICSAIQEFLSFNASLFVVFIIESEK